MSDPRPFLIVAADLVKTGGMDRANYALADFLARQGRPVQLVAHGVGEGLLVHPNLQWHRVARPFGHDALGWTLLRRAGARRARRLAADHGRVLVNGGNCPWPDLNWVHYVHAAYESNASPPAGGPLRQAWQARKHRRALADERRALAAARLVIANSERTKRDLTERLSLPPARVAVVYYGSDPKQFPPITAAARAAARAELGWPQDRPRALFLGALGDRRKGFDTAFAAWRQLCARPDWEMDLIVAGRGAELQAWRQRVQQAGLGDRIQLLGFRRDVPRLLAASNLLLAPTRYEAYGLGVHEALVRGLPAIVSADAGVAERIPESLRGLLLRQPNHASAAAELADRLLGWRGQADALAPAQAQLAAGLAAWTWDHMAARILELAEAARP